MHADLLPEERLFAALVRLSIKDATLHKDERVRQDAARWLWWVAPSVAKRVGIVRINRLIKDALS